jgi:hypothetical protein
MEESEMIADLSHNELLKKLHRELPWSYAYTELVFNKYVELHGESPRFSHQLFQEAPYLDFALAEKRRAELEVASSLLKTLSKPRKKKFSVLAEVRAIAPKPN